LLSSVNACSILCKDALFIHTPPCGHPYPAGHYWPLPSSLQQCHCSSTPKIPNFSPSHLLPQDNCNLRFVSSLLPKSLPTNGKNLSFYHSLLSDPSRKPGVPDSPPVPCALPSQQPPGWPLNQLYLQGYHCHSCTLSHTGLSSPISNPRSHH
jgi:hypothetical protein